MLEKKWTAVVRLQKRVMELEAQVKQLDEELKSAQPGAARHDRCPKRAPDPSVVLPSISLDVWSGGLAKFLGFRQLLLLASSSKALARLLVPHAQSSSVWMTCCANADSSHVRRMLVVAAKHGKTDYLQCLLRLSPAIPPASKHMAIRVKGQVRVRARAPVC